jgi:hypothetical protein
VDEEIARAVRAFEATPAVDPLVMFDHAYRNLSPALAAQRAEMQARLAQAPAEGAAAAAAPSASGDGEAAPVSESPPMRGQRRPWRS